MAELYDMGDRASRTRSASDTSSSISERRAIVPMRALILLLSIAAVGAWSLGDIGSLIAPTALDYEPVAAEFHVCGDDDMQDCARDASTFFYKGEAIVIGDMTAPRSGAAAACPAEARLAATGAQRLAILLDGGAFQMRPDVRPTDAAGRKLRILSRDGVSLGQLLVGQGVAKSAGSPADWCAQSSPSTRTSPTG